MSNGNPDRGLWLDAIAGLKPELDAFRKAVGDAAADAAFDLMEQGPAVMKIRRNDIDGAPPIPASEGARRLRRAQVTTLVNAFGKRVERLRTERARAERADAQANGGIRTYEKNEDGSKPFYLMTDAEKTAERARVWPLCQAIANQPDILKHAARELRTQGVIDEEHVTYEVLMSTTSRVFPPDSGYRIISGTLTGESSIGKSHTAEGAIWLCPPYAFYRLTSASEKALIYEPIGSFRHRIVFLAEATALLVVENSMLALFIRCLQTEKEFKYPVPVLGEKGPAVTILLIQPGPTGLLTTTTKFALHAENDTRQIRLELDASPAHTQDILAAQSLGLSVKNIDPAAWHAYFRWIECGPGEVWIPYRARLNEMLDTEPVRMRRDAAQLSSLIAASALMHQATRQADPVTGAVIATGADYKNALKVIGPAINRVSGKRVTKQMLDVYGVMKAEVEAQCAVPSGVLPLPDTLLGTEVVLSVAEIAQRAKIGRTTAWRALQEAIRSDLLRKNEKAGTLGLRTLNPPAVNTPARGGLGAGEALPNWKEIEDEQPEWDPAWQRARDLLAGRKVTAPPAGASTASLLP
jgi:hypothetical protein